MRTVLLGDRPAVIRDWLESRRAKGQDLFDEVWEGEYHVAPAPHGRHGIVDHQLARLLGPLADRAGLRGSGPCNIGHPDDYRVPDQAYFRDTDALAWSPTAAIVVEVVSPGDESLAKLDFYARAEVLEVIIADPDTRAIEILVRDGTAFRPAAESRLLGIGSDELARSVTWPD